MSSETVSEERSVVQSAVAATSTDNWIGQADGEECAKALASKAAMLDLQDQLTNMDDGTILAEVALRALPAISWLPQAVQKILAANRR